MALHQQDTPMRYSVLDGTPLVGRWGGGTKSAQAYRLRLPHVAWAHNPWTGKRRDARDIESDPHGLLIIPPDEDVVAHRPEVLIHPPVTPEEDEMHTLLAERQATALETQVGEPLSNWQRALDLWT